MDQRDEQMYSRYTRPGLVPVFFHVICFFSAHVPGCSKHLENNKNKRSAVKSCCKHDEFIVNAVLVTLAIDWTEQHAYLHCIL